MCFVGISMVLFISWLRLASAAVVFQSRFDELEDTSRINTITDDRGVVQLRFDSDDTTSWFVRNKSVCTLNNESNTWIRFPSLGVIESGRAALSVTMRAGYDLDVRLAGLISIRISPYGYREISVFNDTCGMWCNATDRALVAIVDPGKIGPNTTTHIEAYWTIAPKNVGNGNVTVTILQQGTDVFSMTSSVAQSSTELTGMPLWMVLARWYNDVCFHSMTVENGTFFPTTLSTSRSSRTSGSTMTASMSSSSLSTSTVRILPSTVGTLFAFSSSTSGNSEGSVPLAVGLSVSIILLILIALFIYLWRRRQPKVNGASAEEGAPRQHADTPSNANQNNYGNLASITRVVHEYESAETPLQA
jgi:hypothetical protein